MVNGMGREYDKKNVMNQKIKNKKQVLSTEDMLAELQNIPAEQLVAALKEYLAVERVDKNKLH